MLVLGFAELLGGGLLLTSAVTGHSVMDVLAGRASPIKALTGGQASPGTSTLNPFTRGGEGAIPGIDPNDHSAAANALNMYRAGGGRVVISPSADRPGVPTDQIVKTFAGAMSVIIGKPVTIGTGSNHGQYTASGNISDHWGGKAMDIPVGLTGQLSGDVVAAAALALAGVPNAAQVARGGGIHNITPTKGPFRGIRIQIIWRAPDHYDHVHVGFS
jgi:hypothetical protein